MSNEVTKLVAQYKWQIKSKDKDFSLKAVLIAFKSQIQSNHLTENLSFQQVVVHRKIWLTLLPTNTQFFSIKSISWSPHDAALHGNFVLTYYLLYNFKSNLFLKELMNFRLGWPKLNDSINRINIYYKSYVNRNNKTPVAISDEVRTGILIFLFGGMSTLVRPVTLNWQRTSHWIMLH